MISEATTQGVRVRVAPRFHPERSDPSRSEYFFSYAITIANEGAAPIRVVARHWVITDANGRVEHVRGAGVVGETPRLEPGEAFEYTSFCPLSTSIGTMKGHYLAVYDDGTGFDVEIAEFTLVDPSSLN